MQAAKLIGNNPLLVNYAYSSSFFNINSIYAQSLRWHVRKPIWLPTAKTKVFRVPKRPVLLDDEAKEIQRLYNNYRTYMKSIKNYFEERFTAKQITLDDSITEKAEEEDFAKSMELNDAWNKEVAQKREIRLREVKEARQLCIIEAIEDKKIRDAELKEKIEKKVRQVKLEVAAFITQDNIDQAIEDALNQVTDYNKALDTDGTWYTDKSGLPPPTIPKVEKVQISQ